MSLTAAAALQNLGPLILGRTDGLTKLILDPDTERVLGMGIVGAGAVEMAAVAHDLADTIHAHPTLSETVMEAAEAFFGQATHLYGPGKEKSPRYRFCDDSG